MKLKFVPILLFVVAVLAFQFLACTKNKVPLPELNNTCLDTVRYSTFVQPLMATNCSTSGCHDASGEGGYVLQTYSQIKNNAGIILKSIRHDGVAPMPKDQDKLADSLATKFNCWIVQGSLDN